MTPGLTIKDRLRVLQPNDPDSYYASRELVPGDMLDEVNRAKIVITNIATNETRELRSDSAGRYVQPFLLPGTHTVSAEKVGFRSVVQENVKVDVAQNRSVNLTLEVGGVTQEVRVEAAPSQVDLNTSTVGQLIENKRIMDLPLGNCRPACAVIWWE